MNKISQRHHYLPEFYLNGFTNNNKEFLIYLIKEGRFKKNGKYFSPKSHFFENDANTLYNENDSTDFLEQSYSESDDMVAKIFEKVKTSNEHNYGITDYEIAILQYFVAKLFWRIPINKEVIERIIKNRTLKQLGLVLKDKNTNLPVSDEQFENKLKSDPNFLKLAKQWLPTATYLSIMECKSPITIIPFPDKLPAICSDNPLIFRNPIKLDIYKDDFILPLTSEKILIRTKKVKKQIHTNVKVEIDMLLLMQANEYVCSTDLTYPIILKQVFSNEYKSVENIRNKIFEKLCEE